MVRKLSLMLVLTLGLVPLVAQALGLGDIKLHSALNQKFNAEIELLSLGKGEIYDVKVGMASDEAFKRSGVDRTFLLTTLTFKPVLKDDGTPIVEVTSKEPIREPFLNFLIEVNWPKGRLIREYTVLLDPPVTLKRKPAPIQAPKITPEPPAPTQTEAAPTIEQAPISDTPYTGEVGEVKVQNNQSLWVIARNNQHQGVDHTRMMMAIYHANPQAFIKSNINRLKKGAILRIPEKEEVLALGAREAQREYQQHVLEWQADRLGLKKTAEPEIAEDAEQTPEEAKSEEAKSEEEVAEGPKTEAEQKKEAGQEAKAEPKEEADLKPEEEKKAPAAEGDKPEAVAAQEPEAKEDKEASNKAELKIATARPEGKGEAGPSEDGESKDTVARLKQELLILEESAESTRSENEELSTRVNDLEDQVNDLERILELKNKQFAALQAALAKAKKEQIILAESQKQQEPEAAGEAEPTPAPEEKQQAVTEEKQPEAEPTKTEEKPATEMAKEGPEVAQKKPEPAVEVAKPKPVVEEKQPNSVVKPITKAEEKPAKVVATPPREEPEPSLLGSILTSPTLLGIAIAVVMVLLALVWILMSRKHTNTADFQESILLNTIDEEAESSLSDASNIPAHTEETSFLSDFSPSDIDALQDETGEVDPLSEADVYIAYGRYQQAEELIRQAIDREPERGALKHKLFEILYATKDTDGFIKLVEEASGTTVETRDSAAWQRVLSMGKMLSPKYPKFVNADEIEADGDLFSLDDDVLEDDGGESDFADLDETLTQAEFGAGAGDKQPDAAKHEGKDGLSSDDLLEISSDLDDTGAGLDDLDFDTNMDDDFISAALDELEGLDETLETDHASKDTTDNSDDEFTLTLSDLEDEGEKTILSLQDDLNEGDDAEEESNTLQDDVLANELEDTHLDISDMESEEGDSELVSLGELDVDLSISEDTPDEVSTKLDLARAYIEMGDKEGAVDILDEVLSEGDATQKGEAQKIKDSIS